MRAGPNLIPSPTEAIRPGMSAHLKGFEPNLLMAVTAVMTWEGSCGTRGVDC